LILFKSADRLGFFAMDLRMTISIVGLLSIFSYVSLSVRRNWRKPRLDAGEKFSEFFREEIKNLSQPKGDAYELLKFAFFKEEKAYLEFRARLKGKPLRQFDEAWKEYYCRDKKDPYPFPEQYFAAGDPAMAEEKRHLALRRIKKLLFLARK
jgi:hypothetical protein